ncbi:MAG: outer membrane protein assembly factor BamB [Gammaproteobacteria bacterium]|nr:outer membrane protein assembly factor BamB [Gammaproteobacteria bacterium]
MKRFVVCLVGAGLLISGCKSRDRGTEWGTYQEPTVPQALPEAAGLSELNVLWRRNLGAGAEDGYALLEPAYGGDGIYAASRSGRVFKLAPEDGSIRWQRDLGAEIFSGVGVHGQVEVAVVALDDGTLMALDTGTGETLWEAALGRQISAVPVVGSERVIARTADGLVVGLDAGAGDTVWSFQREVPGLSVHGDSPPLISGDAVFVGLANGKLLANSVVTGREYWETEVSLATGRNELERLTDSDTAPLVSATTLYTATYQGHVAALQLRDAALKWKARVSSRLPMSIGGGRLLVTSELGEVVALDAESGDLLWTQEGFRGHGMSRPLVIGGRVIVGDARGNIYSLDSGDGALLEKRSVVNGAVVALVPGPGQFAVLSSTGRLSVLSLRTAQN